MLKLKVYSIGKTKESWLKQALQEYLKRLAPVAHVEFLDARNDVQLIEWLTKETILPICLDRAGVLMGSKQFASWFQDQVEKNGSRLVLVIGGPEGIPSQLKRSTSISLSPMTFTHQMTRLVLLEQIYRACEIIKGSSYHK